MKSEFWICNAKYRFYSNKADTYFTRSLKQKGIDKQISLLFEKKYNKLAFHFLNKALKNI